MVPPNLVIEAHLKPLVDLGRFGWKTGGFGRVCGVYFRQVMRRRYG